jgi:outer membrane protein assembly factor BamD
MAFVSFRARMILARVLCVVAVAAVAAACSSAPKAPPVGAEEPDKYLFEYGQTALKEKRWFVAREFFRQLIDSYPQSPFRADAKLGVGDAYLGEGSAESQIMAINEFKEFLTFFPTHERADYAQFQLGMAHFNEMRSPARDQSETKDAIAEFTTFVERYPNSKMIGEARQKLREAKDRLSEHDFRVGLHYLRSRTSLPGAIDRFNTILKNDPEYTHRDEVYYHMAQALVQIGQPAAAIPYLDKLIAEFEQSEYLERSREQVTKLKADMEALIKK